jgi:hypothetical protein
MAKPFHVGVDVDELAYPLHRPMIRSCQTRGQGLLPGVVLSCRCSGWWRLSEGCEAHRTWIFDGVLTIRVPAVLVLEAPGRFPSRVTRLGCNRLSSALGGEMAKLLAPEATGA